MTFILATCNALFGKTLAELHAFWHVFVMAHASLLEQPVLIHTRPAVEMDGGAIQFRSYSDGVVNLMLQGSCSGCPSSMITLKAGIEGMMKRMIPEVKEAVAESE